MYAIKIKKNSPILKIKTAKTDARIVSIGKRGLPGITGPPGQDGPPGQGLITGGLVGQYLRKASLTDFDLEWIDPILNVSQLVNDVGYLTQIPDHSVSFSKIQQISGFKLLGNSNIGSSDVEELTLGTNLSIIGTTLNADFPLTGNGTSFTVNQTGHGLSVGDVIKNSGVANTFEKAQADSSTNAEVVGYVSSVINSNIFTLVTHGLVTTGVPAIAAGSVLFLSPTTPGALTATEPTGDGEVSKPLAIVLESSVKMLFNNFRGKELISIGGGGGGSPLTVQDIDGTPSISNVTTIRVTNSTLTDDGAGQVTINTGGSGNVSGPGSSTDNALTRFDGTTGQLIQNSNAILTDAGALSLGIDLAITEGGTGASTALIARNNLGSQAFTIYTIGSANADYITDGVADNVQIQQALDDLNSVGGGEVFIKAGTYNLSSSITLYANITIRGAGIKKTIIRKSSGADAFSIGGNGGTSSGTADPAGTYANINFYDFEFDAQTTGPSAIALYAPANVHIERLYIHDGSNYGIYIANGSNIWVKNCIIENFSGTGTQACIQFKGVWNGWVVDNYCYNNHGGSGTQGIDSHQTDGVNGRNGKYNHILGNRVDLCGQGINNEDDDTEIMFNTVTNTQGSGQYAIGLRTTPTNIIIANNIIDGSASGVNVAGIDTFNVTAGTNNITITGNTIRNMHGSTASDGIFIGTNALNVSCTNNTISNSGRYGVYNRSTRVVWANNKFYDDQGTPTQIQGIFNDTDASIVGIDLAQTTSTGVGSLLLIKGQDATVGGTNLAAGEVRISTGIGTGNANNIISFYTANTTASGTTAQSLTEKMRLFGSTNGRLVLGATSISTGLIGDGFTLGGGVARGIQMNRHPTNNTAGNALTITAGGASATSSTDKAGGNLILQPGVSTGTASSQVLIQTPTPGLTGTADNSFVTRVTIDSTGIAITVPLTLTTQLAVPQGGTGATTLSGILKGNGTSAITGSATLNDLGSPVSDFSMNSHKITNLTDPTANQDAATKAYVDSVAQGLDAKASCRVATTGNITLSGTQTIDGVSVIAGDRVLVKNQSTASQNGIYDVAAGAWGRSADADTDPEVTSGLFTFITSGSVNANTGWVLTTTGTIILDTTALFFTQFSAVSSIVAGNGLTLTGSTMDIVGTTNRISVVSDSIDISSSYVGQASITTLGTISTGIWQGTTIDLLYGGTGATTASGARTNLGLAIGTDVQGYDATLASLAAYNTNGLLTQTAADTFTGRSISGTTNRISMTNGDGVSGNPIIDISSSYIGQSTITTLGTITTGIWNGSAIPIANGGTGQTSQTNAFDALAPTTTQGDLIYHNGTDNIRLAKGTVNQHLRMNSGATAPEWATIANRNFVELGSDVASTASTSFQNITGLSFSVTSGVNYRFYAIIPYTTSAATIGIRVSLTAPATTILAYETRTGLAATGSATNLWYNSQSTTDAGVVSTSSQSTTAGNVIIIEGFIRPSASGTVQLRFAPETATANGVIIKAGASLEWW